MEICIVLCIYIKCSFFVCVACGGGGGGRKWEVFIVFYFLIFLFVCLLLLSHCVKENFQFHASNKITCNCEK